MTAATSTITPTVSRINERIINTLLDRVPIEAIENIIQGKLPKPKRARTAVYPPPVINHALREAVMYLNLIDEPNIEQRIHLFIGYCKFRNYSYNTTRRYFKILRLNGIFGPPDTTIAKKLVPDKYAFAENGKHHTRVVSMSDFAKLTTYLHENTSKYTAPLLIAVYTGLRTFEILQFSTSILMQLKSMASEINIKRKQTVVNVARLKSNAKNNTTEADDDGGGGGGGTNVAPHIYWQPVYNAHLIALIESLMQMYKTEYDAFMEMGINVPLFPIKPKTLGNRIRHAFFLSTGNLAPYGFGVHSCRNMVATIMSQTTENITAIQMQLQHKNSSTTRRYIQANFNYVKNEFNRLTDQLFANERLNLENPEGKTSNVNSKELKIEKPQQ